MGSQRGAGPERAGLSAVTEGVAAAIGEHSLSVTGGLLPPHTRAVRVVLGEGRALEAKTRGDYWVLVVPRESVPSSPRLQWLGAGDRILYEERLALPAAGGRQRDR